MTISTDRDALRLEIGDTDTTNYLFADDELDYFLSVESSLAAAKLAACRAGELRLAREYDFETDGQKFARSQMAKAFAVTIDRLEKAGVTTSGVAFNIATLASTKIDGYTQDIASDEVSVQGTAFANPRQRFYQVDGIDRLP